MEYVLLIISLILIFLGLLGSFLPVLPGPPLSWIGLLVLQFVPGVEMNYWLLSITFIITIVVVVLDYVIPAQGTKKFGGTSYGVWGTNIGLILGIVTPVPFGFIIGPFVGAFVGELIHNPNNTKGALKAASGSFIGFIASSFMKFVLCMIFLGIFIKMVLDYKHIWF